MARRSAAVGAAPSGRGSGAGTVRGRARARRPPTDRPVQPGQGLRHPRRDPGRPRVHRVARPPPDLRRASPSAPAAWPPTCTAAGLGVHRERAELAGLGVGPGPRGARPLQRQRVPRGDAGLVPGPRGPVQRQLPLRRRGAALPAQRRPAPRHDPALLAGPDAGRGAAHAGRRRPTCCSRSRTNRATPSSPGRSGTRRRWPHPRPTGAPVDPSPDDLYILYTGGTTGMPKGVLWRQHDIFMAAMGGRKVGTWEIVHELRGPDRAAGRELPAAAAGPAAAHARRGAVGLLHADGAGGDAASSPTTRAGSTPTTCGRRSSARRRTP